MFILDLGVISRNSHEIKFREALVWTLVWVSLAFAFNVWIYFYLGPTKALEFFTGYVIEESLSVDNLFVFIMIFSYFKMGKAHQPKILKWGIIGALLMRGIFIFAGIGLLERFHWMVYIFGGLLVFTGVKMAFGGEERIEPEKNLLVRLVGRFFPVSTDSRCNRFFIKEKGRLTVTPLFLTLLVVESSDVIFAMDSIPAILAVTRDPFIVYTSNIFAIMGLRSLYYLLANVMDMFVYLKIGISFILAFVGVKMLVADHYPIPIHISLIVIVSVLAIAVIASLTIGKNRHPHF
jgi:tellurite resistance protein TerC